MEVPLQITARGFELTPAIEDAIRKRADKLDHRGGGRVTGCRVVIERPHAHHHKGSPFDVRIDLTVPGAELAVTHEPHEDLYVALRDAFEAAGRQVAEHFERIRERARQNHRTES
jgi:ribosome-associated translation inhibitor RaiA